ncbi:hypothetical protein PMAYCL1PPCAC_25496, partial [Pristionchus mayeri]
PMLALERICHHLYNPFDGKDLANLSKVSHHYNNVVMKFMGEPNNRPGIKKVQFQGRLNLYTSSVSGH